MATRASIIVKDRYDDKLYFYKHWDGYPSGILPALEYFMSLVKSGEIRDNVGQAAGHLIMIGHDEYLSEGSLEHSPWKVGAFEPASDLCGGIEYLYILDLKTKTIEVVESDFDKYSRSVS